MPFRSSWKGYLKLSLVSVPVVSYSAIKSQEGEIHFHQLHDQCHSRIKYVKTCPIHGPVPPDEIVSGYEFQKGEYVIVEKQELIALRSDEEKTIELNSIISTEALDPIYLTDRSFYLVPDGQIAQKPYAVIEQCLREQNRIALGRRVTNGKDEVVAIRPTGKLLVMTSLSDAVQVNAPESLEGEVKNVDISASERKMTKTLLDSFFLKKADMSQFKDEYNARVAELVEAKVHGKKIVHKVADEQPGVINLMDALKKSLSATARSKSSEKRTPNAINSGDIKRAIIASKSKKTKRA